MLKLRKNAGKNLLWILPALFLTLASCNQNPSFTSAPAIAPAPITAGLPSGVPAIGQTPFAPGAAGTFYPSIPPGMPTQFYPFLPIYNYFQQNPTLQSYWSTMWSQWSQYAYQNGYNQYNFTPFWTQFCPSQWSQGSWADMYAFFDYNVYYWMTPQMQFPPSANPSAFWQYYIGFSYSPLNSWF